MDWTFAALLSEVRLSLQTPRDGLRRMLAVNPPMSARWIGLLIVALGSTLQMHIGLALTPVEDLPAVFQAAMLSPLATAAAQAISLVVAAHLVHRIGRAFGGRGDFPDSLLAVVWFNLLLLFLQTVGLLAELLVPPLAAGVFFAVFVLMFWLMTNFVAELHGFSSLPRTFFGILIAFLAIGVALAFCLAVLARLTMGVPA